MRRSTWVITIILGVLVLGAAPARADRSTLVLGLSGIPETMDPHLRWATTWLPPYYALYDALTVIGDNNDALPNLATSWKRVDPLTWDFHLREGVKFHNGESLTAVAVKFSFDRVLDPATKAGMKFRIPTLKSVEALNSLTVRFVTATPDPNVPRVVSVIFILPPKYFNEKGAAGFAEAPIGTGLFRFAEFKRNVLVKLQATEGDWRRPPKIKTSIFKELPENATRMAALRSGDVDIINPVQPDEAQALEHAGFHVSASYAGWSYVIQMKGSTQSGSALANPSVRQALNYAVNKDAIIKYVLHGYAKLLEGQNVGRDAVGYNAAVKAYPFDPAKAHDLLKQAGFPNGFDATWYGTVGFFPNDKEIIEAVIGDLSKIGLRIKFQTVDQGSFQKRLFDGTQSDLFLVRWTYSPSFDLDFVLNMQRCESGLRFFCDKQIDRMFEESRRAPNQAAREKLLQKITEHLHDGPNAIFLFQPGNLSAMAATVRGFTPRSEAILWLDTIDKER